MKELKILILTAIWNEYIWTIHCRIRIICSYQDYQHHLKYYKINTISNKRWLRWWKSHTGISLVGHLVNRHFQLSGMSMHYHVHCACATLIIMTRICCFLQCKTCWVQLHKKKKHSPAFVIIIVRASKTSSRGVRQYSR